MTGSPLWKRGPLRSTNSQVRPSFDTVHDSARLGVLRLPGIGLTSASCSAYITMNGVISASVSAVSSQRLASVTWTAHVMVPVGSAAAAAAGSRTSMTSQITVRTIRVIGASPVR